MSFRATATASGVNSVAVTIPASVQAGDGMLLIAYVNNDCTIATPSGWVVAKSQQSAEVGGATAAVFKRVALGTDANSTVTVTNDVAAGGKAGALLIAYSASDQVDPVHAIGSVLYSPTQSSHATPSIATTVADCQVVEVAVTKNSSATTFSAVPAGATSRVSLIGTGGGHADGAIADRGPVAIGSYGGGSFTQDAAASSSITYTIAVAPRVSTQTLRPQSDITIGDYTAVPAPGAGVALASRIGEPIRDDSSYIQTAPSPVSAVYEARLAAGLDPLSSVGHTVAVVLSTAGGATSSTCVVALVQGTTVIASTTATNVPSTPTTYSFTLSGAEADAITDYGDLRLRFTWTAA